MFGALKYAGRLPYRPGVSKTIILITCSPGNDGSFYGDAMTMLTEQVKTVRVVRKVPELHIDLSEIKKGKNIFIPLQKQIS